MDRRRFLQMLAGSAAALSTKTYFVFGSGLWRPPEKVLSPVWESLSSKVTNAAMLYCQTDFGDIFFPPGMAPLAPMDVMAVESAAREAWMQGEDVAKMWGDELLRRFGDRC